MASTEHAAVQDGTLRVTLRLKAIEHLFADPDLSPFDPYYAPYSFAAGMEFLVGEIQRAGRVKQTELTVLLPADQVASDPGLEARTREAIHRYSEAWATSARQERDVERIRAQRVLGAAVLFFVIANLLYIRYGQTGSLLGFSGLWLDVVVEGLSVGAWVALWWPLDQLMHTVWQYRQEERAYRALQEITLRILPDADRPDALAVGSLPTTR